jgi:hypothetical protein
MGRASRKAKVAARTRLVRQLNSNPPINDQLLRWPVVRGGYEWITVGGVPGKQPTEMTVSEVNRFMKKFGFPAVDSTLVRFPIGIRVLTENAEQRVRPEADQQSYTPAKAHRLFEEFARLKPNEEAFKQFADEHGLLGVDPSGSGRDTIPVTGNVIGEPFWAWRLAHHQIAEAVHLWKSKDDASRLQGLVNTALDGHATVRVVWNEKRYLLRAFPSTLLGSMWMSFARTALTGEARFQQCGACPDYVEIAKGVRTKSTVFCSPRCRQRNYRSRVIQAKKLKVEGWSLNEIAGTLEPDKNRVK